MTSVSRISASMAQRFVLNIDRLALEGLRYNNFHTRAICSPTRAALLTGRNSHSVGVRTVAAS